MKKLIWMGCLSYFIIGLAHVVVGPVLEPLIKYYGVSYKDGGQLIMNQFFGFLVGVLIAPWLIAKLGRRRTILLSLGCLTAAETVYSFFPPWGWMLKVTPIAGFGFGITESVIGAMILAVIVEKRTAAMARLEIFFGLGALVMPGVAAIFLRSGLWEDSFPFVAVLSGVMFLTWLFISFGPATDRLLTAATVNPVNKGDEEEFSGAVAAKQAVRRMIPLLILGSIFFFLYVGTEMSFANYIPSILHLSSGLSESNAALAASLFWASMAIGRWVLSIVADRVRYKSFLLLTCAGTGGLLILMALTSAVSLSFVLLIILGLVMAGMFTMGLIFINDVIPGTTERTTSILIACGGLGGALLPKLTGSMMDNYSPTTSLWLMAGDALGMLLVIGIAVRLSQKKPHQFPLGKSISHVAEGK